MIKASYFLPTGNNYDRELSLATCSSKSQTPKLSWKILESYLKMSNFFLKKLLKLYKSETLMLNWPVKLKFHLMSCNRDSIFSNAESKSKVNVFYATLVIIN